MSPETGFGPTDRPAGGAAIGANAHGSTRALFATISQAEAKAWVSFFTLAGRDAAFAAEITRLFDADPPLRRNHLALYLCGRACLCQHQARQQRRQRHGARVRAATGFVVRHLLAGPWAALKAMADGRSDRQPLILPAIMWDDRETVDPPVSATMPARQAAAQAKPSTGLTPPQLSAATLVHCSTN